MPPFLINEYNIDAISLIISQINWVLIHHFTKTSILLMLFCILQDIYFKQSQLKEEDLITIIEKFSENTDQHEVKESAAPYYQHRTNFGLKQPNWVKDLIPYMKHSIPVFNSIPAGEPHELTDSRYILKNADEFVITGVRDVHAHVLVVIGDIMEPTLNKCVVAYRLNNGKARLSRFRQIGTEIYLESDADIK